METVIQSWRSVFFLACFVSSTKPSDPDLLRPGGTRITPPPLPAPDGGFRSTEPRFERAHTAGTASFLPQAGAFLLPVPRQLRVSLGKVSAPLALRFGAARCRSSLAQRVAPQLTVRHSGVWLGTAAGAAPHGTRDRQGEVLRKLRLN